jgi:hypothetical protein
MERLFSPCTRLQDLIESQGEGGRPRGLQELNLNVSTEELVSAERAFTYADLHAMLGNEDMVAWLTPHAAVASNSPSVFYSWRELGDTCRFCISADGKEIVASARSLEYSLEICDVVLRLLAASVVRSVNLSTWDGFGDVPVSINAPTLASLIEQCQSLKVLSLKDLPEIDENHCRVLGAYSRPDLEILLSWCKITSAGAVALAEVLGRNQGPTKLDSCDIDYSVLANGLRGNSRLKSLRPCFSSNLEDDNRIVLAIAGALRENKGLVELNLCPRWNDETWGATCDSLKTHPTLQVLDLRAGRPPWAPKVLTSRMQVLVDMMKVNTSIHTLHLPHQYSEHEFFRELVIPYLETNRLRPRVRAIQKTRPIVLRAKVLGRALLSARTDANLFWMLLSGNPEVAFPSTIAATTLAATLPTPATVGASANATTGAANSVATVPPATNVAAPASGQKRKACP